ncbi:glucocorticoid receptor [Latimeria chalumnae]|uniref:Glucocorticoid receptor n=1 Tax=Latimeria chalumnae TaxID=7897 RepID=H3B6W7_LATCH|nr:PREDICTED: glucocorticoid receptor [Latimeria chalumnae]XP_005996163.1 PREDICTED: glucocorticoid receptor [Latimeria chalumnae]XP_014343931.1 PREDICTED: glucocorticoid receptor [Latimeria chalumnae]|eukprot:XP_005996162.1 PREDICTED: glucocorticoid receptor [Latimeria chalumnae]
MMESKEVLNTSGGDSLKCVDYSKREEVYDFNPVFRGGAPIPLTPASSLLLVSEADSPRQLASGDTSNGVSGNATPQDLSQAVSESMGLYMGESDSKVIGQKARLQKQGQISGLSVETEFALLEESIASLNRSTRIGEVSGSLAPGQVSLDNGSGMAKCDLSVEQETFAQTDSDPNGNLSFFPDDQAAFDILQELDLTPCSPGKENPWSLDPIYDGGGRGLLSPLAADDPFLMAAVANEDCKSSLVTNTSQSTNNECGNLFIPDLSSQLSQIKSDKEGYIELLTPGVVKQETLGRSYCQANLTSAASTTANSSISIHGVNTSGGQMYHYDVNAGAVSSAQQPDQKPIFNFIPPVSTIAENWNRCQGSGATNSTPPLGNVNASGRSGFASSYPSPGTRTATPTPSSSSTSSGPPHKICLVCSDEASGCHYGVLTCGSCKVFFKRAVEGQHNYLCAGRNDCIIDKIRRKNCPACRFRKCLQAGMNLEARKSKKLNKMKGNLSSKEQATPPLPERAVVPASVPQLTPTMISLLEAIEPSILYSGYDSTIPDTHCRLMTALNKLGGRQVVAAVKWAKALPGFRSLHLDDQMVLLQYSWMFLMAFGLGWRSYQQANGSMLCFAPDLIINEQRMQLPYMYEQCQHMLKIASEFSRLQVSYEEYLCMKALLLLSTIPQEGLKSQPVFDEIRMTYIKELGKAIVKKEGNSNQNWQRFYQLTKLLDSMHDVVKELLKICFHTFVDKSLSVEFPEMLAEIISNQLPKVTSGSCKALLFHQN